MVTTLTASDDDLDPAFQRMDFAIEVGNVDGTFGLDWEPYFNYAQLRLLRVSG